MRVVLISLLFLFEFFSFPAQALYCGRHLVTERDSAYEVLAACGHPQFQRKWEDVDQTGVSALQAHPQLLLVSGVSVQHASPTQFEEWTYNFGPHRLLQKLTFKNGELVKIESDGYGFN